MFVPRSKQSNEIYFKLILLTESLMPIKPARNGTKQQCTKLMISHTNMFVLNRLEILKLSFKAVFKQHCLLP